MKNILIIWFFVLIPDFGFAFTQLNPKEPGTHYKITSHAILQSNIENYLFDYLDVKAVGWAKRSVPNNTKQISCKVI